MISEEVNSRPETPREQYVEVPQTKAVLENLRKQYIDIKIDAEVVVE